MDKLYVIISTFNDRAQNLTNVLLEPKDFVTYIVSHQVTKSLNVKTENVIDWLNKREDVIYSKINSRGLSSNRNNALKFLKNGIGLFSDDDVTFYPDSFEKILEAFKINRDADILTFKIKTADEVDFKKYPSKIIKHNFKTIFRVGSVEIAFNVAKIKELGLRFDERFGVGTGLYDVGEEYIFLADAIKKGLKCYFVPIAILKHPLISTGDSLDRHIIFARGAVMARSYGKLAFFMDFLFSLKKYPIYKNKISFYRYLTLMFSGSKSFFNKEN